MVWSHRGNCQFLDHGSAKVMTYRPLQDTSRQAQHVSEVDLKDSAGAKRGRNRESLAHLGPGLGA
jgi:hypothetical protein